uniref:Uncharacterized protein n=1 Tax=Timema tahoe TaxID=61484 RepID=A0A7R9IAN9_9NEOP|nr:unnamed protein product [Timema tahoe]
MELDSSELSPHHGVKPSTYGSSTISRTRWSYPHTGGHAGLDVRLICSGLAVMRRIFWNLNLNASHGTPTLVDTKIKIAVMNFSSIYVTQPNKSPTTYRYNDRLNGYVLAASIVAVVTGASSGIGAAIAQELVKKGLQVVGLDRQELGVHIVGSKWSEISGRALPQVAWRGMSVPAGALADLGAIRSRAWWDTQRGRPLEENVECTPGTFHHIKCDISNDEEIMAAFEWLRNNRNGLDILLESFTARIAVVSPIITQQ